MTTLDLTVIRDGNRKTIWWGVSSVDGTTLVPIQINSTNGGAKWEVGVSVMPVVSALPTTLPRDGNRIPCLGGQSNDSNNVIIPVSVNPSTGAVQVQTT
jgi:hypothetical protein